MADNARPHLGRFALGMGQMFGAVTGATLLWWTGLSTITLIAVALTTALTILSRVRSRRR